MRRRQRGQAMFETAIAMPLFLLVLFGAIWAVKEGTMSERVQMGVRYGGVIGSLENPYYNYSLYRLYNSVQGGSAHSEEATCESEMVYVANGGRKNFFTSLATPSPKCTPGTSILLKGTGSPALSQDVLLMNDLATFQSNVSTGGFLQNSVFGTTSTQLSAVQNFFRAPDIGVLADCTSIGALIARSFDPLGDTVTQANVIPTPIGTGSGAIDDSPISFNSGANCYSGSTPNPGSPPGGTPPPDRPPTPTPPPTATPSPPPSPTPAPPTATPTVKPPTATPSSPPPTSTPTAKPPTPTPAPPTATPKPPTPTPTAGPPTATPTPKPPTPTPAPPTATPTVPPPTATPTVKPPSPTPAPPTATPTVKPPSPTPAPPTATPTRSPSPSPTPVPTFTPTPVPSGPGGVGF